MRKGHTERQLVKNVTETEETREYVCACHKCVRECEKSRERAGAYVSDYVCACMCDVSARVKVKETREGEGKCMKVKVHA